MSSIIHYQPQDPIEIYEPLLNKNYSIARSYYKQKRLLFEKQFYQNTNIAFEEVKKALNLVIEKEWMQKVDEVTSNLISSPIVKQDKVKGYSYKLAKNYSSTDPDVQAIFDYVRARGKRAANPHGELGQRFEPFIKNKIFNNNIISETVSDVAQQNIKSIALELTGKKQSTSALSIGKKSIRPDLMLTFDADFNWNDKWLSGDLTIGQIPTSVELQELIDLGYYDENSINTLMIDYLKSKAYGFNLKYWKNSSGKTFARSEFLKNQLNKTFTQKVPDGLHSWEQEYATAYANWEVSKYLINLINPNVIAIVTGGGFEWVDNFLQSHILRMRVQRNHTRKGDKKLPFESYREGRPTIETLPLVKSSEVYIQTAQALSRSQKTMENLRTKYVSSQLELNVK